MDQTIIRKQTLSLVPPLLSTYEKYPFVVPEGVVKVGIRGNYYRRNNNPRIYISLHDPNGLRGHQMNWVVDGEVQYDLWTSLESASNGAIPGLILTGEWYLMLDISNLTDTVTFTYEIYLQYGSGKGKSLSPLDDAGTIFNLPGWYKGELHSHTIESDGDFTPIKLLKAAKDANLDFIAITDHFTPSAWWKIDPEEIPPGILLLKSLEITSHKGHANLHGLKNWVDVFVDREDWSMNAAADETHRQGGLFCVNHAFSGELGWGDYTFDWSRADLYEIYHHMEGPNNNLQLGLWDSLLREGKRIIGVAGIDFHGTRWGEDKLGGIITYIYTKELSVKGLLDGLRSGEVYISKGPQMEFQVRNSRGEKINMGGSVDNGKKPIELFIKIKTDSPVRVFVIKNGFHWRSYPLNNPKQDVWAEIHDIDQESIPGYFRVEIHSLINDPNYDGIEWRDFTSMKALSNPIWVK